MLIDIREAHEHAREHIEGARLAPLSKLQKENFGDVHDKTAVFHCHSGGRTGSNARLLMSKGFRDVYHLSGGIVAWKAAGLPTRAGRSDASTPPRKRFGWLF
ncbi:MAG: sulfurtransferase [Hyphomicrobiales bacterium]|nr:sulfurtransferase [Hyphomicrobiales bacterium]